MSTLRTLGVFWRWKRRWRNRSRCSQALLWLENAASVGYELEWVAQSEWVSEWLIWWKYSLNNRHRPHPCVSSQVIWLGASFARVESTPWANIRGGGLFLSYFHHYQRSNFSLSRSFHSRTFFWISPLFSSRHWYITFCIDATLALIAEAEKQWPTSLTSQKKGRLASWVKSNSSLLISCTAQETTFSTEVFLLRKSITFAEFACIRSKILSPNRVLLETQYKHDMNFLTRWIKSLGL